MSIPRTCSGHLYDVLEVERNASLEIIRRQYKKLALQYHPDRNNGTTHAKFQEIEEAHRVLSDTEKRQLYDLIGRENMKTMGDNPIVSKMLTNPGGLLALFGCVVVLIGMMFFGLLLAFWRFDRQFAVANQGKADSFSWWWVSLFFWPVVMFVALLGLLYIKLNAAAQSCSLQKVLPAIPLLMMPVVLWGVMAALSGTISHITSAIGLCFVVGLFMFCCWVPQCLSSPDEEGTYAEEGRSAMDSAPSRRNVVVFTLCRVALWSAFLYLVFLCARQQPPNSGGGADPHFVHKRRSDKSSVMSIWYVFLPLLVDCLVCMYYRGLLELDRFLLFAMWAQKLNVELNLHSGYEPSALTASLVIFFYVTIAFTISFFAFCGILARFPVFVRSESNDPLAQPLV